MVRRVFDPLVQVQFEALGNHFVERRCLDQVAAQLVRAPQTRPILGLLTRLGLFRDASRLS